MGRIGRHAETAGHAADFAGLEPSRFEQDGGRRVGHAAFRATHDASDHERTLGIGDDADPRFQFHLLAVEQHELLALAGGAGFDATGDLGRVERVERLAQFEQHPVGDIHHVINWTQPSGFEVTAEPIRARAHLDVLQRA